jgi:LysM repeat protein
MVARAVDGLGAPVAPPPWREGAGRGRNATGWRRTALPAIVALLACSACGSDDDSSGTTSLSPTDGADTSVVAPAATDDRAASTIAGATDVTYVVQAGDTLWEIANQFGVTLTELAVANGLDPDDQQSLGRIQIGTALVIPTTTSATTAVFSTAAASSDGA